MARYDNTRFYWLQLKEDFFDDDAISWLEDQPNGKEYSLFYLKLCLKALKTNGIMIRRVGEMLLPYDYKKLAEITKTAPDTVIVAMELLQKIGLVKTLENGELYITQLENMIGSQSLGAFKKQQQRRGNQLLIAGSGQCADICPPEIEIEKEKEIEVDKKKERKRAASGYDDIINSYTSNEELKQALYEFIKMRKLIKKPLTDYALKRIISKLDSMTADDGRKVAILNQSICNNWQGIFELKDGTYSGKPAATANTTKKTPSDYDETANSPDYFGF